MPDNPNTPDRPFNEPILPRFPTIPRDPPDDTPRRVPPDPSPPGTPAVPIPALPLPAPPSPVPIPGTPVPPSGPFPNIPPANDPVFRQPRGPFGGVAGLGGIAIIIAQIMRELILGQQQREIDRDVARVDRAVREEAARRRREERLAEEIRQGRTPAADPLPVPDQPPPPEILRPPEFTPPFIGDVFDIPRGIPVPAPNPAIPRPPAPAAPAVPRRVFDRPPLGVPVGLPGNPGLPRIGSPNPFDNPLSPFSTPSPVPSPRLPSPAPRPQPNPFTPSVPGPGLTPSLPPLVPSPGIPTAFVPRPIPLQDVARERKCPPCKKKKPKKRTKCFAGFYRETRTGMKKTKWRQVPCSGKVVPFPKLGI